MPSFSSCRYQATDIAMTATVDRSMPRPMMTIAMPSARMPSTETERTMEIRLAEVKKPGKANDGGAEDQHGYDKDDSLLVQ